MPNAAELKALTRTTDLESAIKSIMHFDKIIITIKDGNNGAYLCDGKEIIHQPAFLNAHVLDSIGAGDSLMQDLYTTLLRINRREIVLNLEHSLGQ